MNAVIKTPVQRFNELVEEFDRTTQFKFDTEHDPLVITYIAALWPTARQSLSNDLEVVIGQMQIAEHRARNKNPGE